MDAPQPRRALIMIAWVVTLLISLLPDILFKELTGSLPPWLLWAKVGLLAALLLFSLAARPLRPLRLFFAAVLALYLLEWGVPRAFAWLHYAGWTARTPAFARDLFATQIPRVAIAVLLALVMLALTGSFARFFLVRGKLSAVAAPIPLITSRPSSWRILGPAIAAAMSLGLAVFVGVFGKLPAISALPRVVPLLPFVILFAASNSFGEEMLYRAPWLAALESPVGAGQALLMTAVYFGVGHFYGVPYGVAGVIMAFIPGWLMGKAMLETRGFFWPWLIHFCMDFTIFFFMAFGSIRPGG